MGWGSDVFSERSLFGANLGSRFCRRERARKPSGPAVSLANPGNSARMVLTIAVYRR